MNDGVHHDDRLQRIEGKLDAILSALRFFIKVEIFMAQELDDLKAAVARETEVDQSAVTLLQGLKAKLDAAIAAGDPAALKALSDQLGSNSQALADAITQNTPAESGGGPTPAARRR